MDVALYTAAGGTFVLVPACMHPTQQAERLHGPLTPCARARLPGPLDDTLCTRLLAEIDQNAFALLQWPEALALLGRKHPCFRKRPRRLWPRVHGKRVSRV
ncbi:hypothetical protein LVB87_08085 [Lysobacter sp. KIS68-7]|uniref:hypothetical protein n=1 Tax=Lysobacter sp. KIS68-7 TaxID=2904252 RepID=UPI001E4B4686|nr:hypothetical protein [Lysobacter sp. KIS68-7]UHQ18191.1 hypothetical protein LVB87_08085 [Lysobacter sp. KIS68-7]